MMEENNKKNISFYVSQNCSVYSLKYLLKNHLWLKDKNLSNIEIILEKSIKNTEETEKIPVDALGY